MRKLKQAPTKRVIKFILAEEVRNEGDGKFSLLGVFPGERLAIAGELPPGLANAAFAMQSLVCVFLIAGGEGKHSARFKITAPDKATTILETPTEQPLEIKRDHSAVFVSGIRPFLGPAFGTYVAELQIGKIKYKFPFTIDKASPKLSAK